MKELLEETLRGSPSLHSIMLKGSRDVLVTKVQPVSIHGQISLDIYWVDPEDSQGQVSLARIGPESVQRHRGRRSRDTPLYVRRRDVDYPGFRIKTAPAPNTALPAGCFAIQARTALVGDTMSAFSFSSRTAMSPGMTVFWRRRSKNQS